MRRSKKNKGDGEKVGKKEYWNSEEVMLEMVGW